MAIHELKTDRKWFRLIYSGRKPYELRFNDRDYRYGDVLILKETRWSGEEMKAGKGPLEYTGRVVEAIVSHVLYGPVYGLEEGWAILSIRVERRIDPQEKI